MVWADDGRVSREDELGFNQAGREVMIACHWAWAYLDSLLSFGLKIVPQLPVSLFMHQRIFSPSIMNLERQSAMLLERRSSGNRGKRIIRASACRNYDPAQWGGRTPELPAQEAQAITQQSRAAPFDGAQRRGFCERRRRNFRQRETARQMGRVGSQMGRHSVFNSRYTVEKPLD